MKLTARQMMIAALIAVCSVILLVSRCGVVGETSGVTIQPPVSAPSASAAGESASVSTSPSSTAGTVGTEDPSHDDDDDGDDGAGDDEPPILVQPTSQPDVKEAATQFAAAWLNAGPGQSDAAWRDALTKRVTSDLAEDLAYADPASVPAGVKVGQPIDITAEGSLFNADAPIVDVAPGGKKVGTLKLTLVRDSGRWLVSEIDWQVTQ